MEKIIINDHIQGDPLSEENLDKTLEYVNRIRLSLPEKTIWLYTGYTWESCTKHPVRREIVTKCDVVVDGRYINELRNITLRWRGSSNQRVIDVQNTLKGEMTYLRE